MYTPGLVPACTLSRAETPSDGLELTAWLHLGWTERPPPAQYKHRKSTSVLTPMPGRPFPPWTNGHGPWGGGRLTTFPVERGS